MKQQNIQQELLQQSQITQNQNDVNFIQHKEEHIQAGEYLKSSIYGGLDGSVNTLTVIIAGIASGAPATYILSVGIAVMIGDGLGMGLGDYLSAKSQKQFIKAQQKRQFWEVKHKLTDEKQQIIEIYNLKGYKRQQSQQFLVIFRRIADLFSTNTQAFVNIMMLQQLGLVVDDSNPSWNGVVTFISFVIFGFLPLIPYVISAGIQKDSQTQFLLVSLIIGGIQLFSLGFAKAVLLGINKFKAGFQTLFLGAVAVAVGYGIGLAFQISQTQT